MSWPGTPRSRFRSRLEAPARCGRTPPSPCSPPRRIDRTPRNHQHLQKIVPSSIAGAWVLQTFETGMKVLHRCPHACPVAGRSVDSHRAAQGPTSLYQDISKCDSSAMTHWAVGRHRSPDRTYQTNPDSCREKTRRGIDHVTLNAVLLQYRPQQARACLLGPLAPHHVGPRKACNAPPDWRTSTGHN